MKPWLSLTLFVVLAGCSTGGGTTVVTPGGTASTKTDASGKTTTTVATPEGNVTATQKGNETTLSGPDGTKIVAGSDKLPELGVEIYPGAKPKSGENFSSSAGAGKTAGAAFTTGDDVEKVTAFYKGKLGATATVSSGNDAGNAYALLSKSDGKVTTTVTVSRNKDEKETTIGVMRTEQ